MRGNLGAHADSVEPFVKDSVLDVDVIVVLEGDVGSLGSCSAKLRGVGRLQGVQQSCVVQRVVQCLESSTTCERKGRVELTGRQGDVFVSEVHHPRIDLGKERVCGCDRLLFLELLLHGRAATLGYRD